MEIGFLCMMLEGYVEMPLAQGAGLINPLPPPCVRKCINMEEVAVDLKYTDSLCAYAIRACAL